jgi:hypothetical protein
VHESRFAIQGNPAITQHVLLRLTSERLLILLSFSRLACAQRFDCRGLQVTIDEIEDVLPGGMEYCDAHNPFAARQIL